MPSVAVRVRPVPGLLPPFGRPGPPPGVPGRRGDDVPRMPTLPRIVPMLATPGTLPPASEDDRWAYETKLDGQR